METKNKSLGKEKNFKEKGFFKKKKGPLKTRTLLKIKKPLTPLKKIKTAPRAPLLKIKRKKKNFSPRFFPGKKTKNGPSERFFLEKATPPLKYGPKMGGAGGFLGQKKVWEKFGGALGGFLGDGENFFFFSEIKKNKSSLEKKKKRNIFFFQGEKPHFFFLGGSPPKKKTKNERFWGGGGRAFQPPPSKVFFFPPERKWENFFF